MSAAVIPRINDDESGRPRKKGFLVDSKSSSPI